jgi:predicted peptidase
MDPTTRTFATDLVVPVRLDYLSFAPRGRPDPGGWPLVLFLHGAGERGADVAEVAACGLPFDLTHGFELPARVVAPQCPADTTWSQHLSALLGLLDHVLAEGDVDPERVVLTGLSMGGTGAWHLAATAPERFAALVPVCGQRTWFIGDAPPTYALRRVPVWAFHGEDDEVVEADASRVQVAALRAAGADARLTLYPGVGHDSWKQAYATPELWTWALEQRRGHAAGGRSREVRRTS